MRRRTFDLLATGIGLVLTVVLFVAGGLLLWGASFTQSSVKTQLSQQQITFPAKGDPQLQNPLIGPYLSPYAGQQLLTGAQAEVYADHFIKVHLEEIGQGHTYAYWSGLAKADPTNTAAATTADLMFKGSTLRGLLLNAYAFWTIGTIAYIAAFASLFLGLVMLVLTILGWRHYRKVPEDEEFLAGVVLKDPDRGEKADAPKETVGASA